jgi:hypothetical protein
MLHQASPSDAQASGRREPFVARHFPALVAAGVYLLCTAGILLASYFRYCHRHFVYSLDDTYITMAMAKNLALHGVWGVSPYAFSSSNSSPIFPLLLAAVYRLFGANQAAPLALSWTFGLLAIFAGERLLRNELSRKAQTFALVLLVMLAPLFVGGVLGMEHSFHTLMTLLFLGYFMNEDSTAAMSRRQMWAMAAVTALMVSARYEGLFLVLPAACVLLALRRWKPLLVMTIGAAAPVCAYAAFSLARGGYWLPNSVALKGAQGDHPSLARMAANIAQRIAENYQEGSEMVWVLALTAVVLVVLLVRERRRSIPVLLLLVAGCLHLALAQNGFYFRYDEYLFAAAVVVLSCTLPAVACLTPKWVFPGIYVLSLVTAGMLLIIGLGQLRLVPRTSRNIYLRQLQMARFVERYYPTGVVAANDIGAIDYFSSIHCYDLVGLANPEIFNARRAGDYTTGFLSADAARQNVQIAIVYDGWFGDPVPVPVGGPPLPQNWTRVARWNIPDPTMLRDRTVSFYAVDPGQVALLRSDLQQFAPELPRPVETIQN